MTSPALKRMARRAKLPISVWYEPAWMLGRSYEVTPAMWTVLGLEDGEVHHITDPAEATRAYLDLVESLETDPGTATSLPGTAAGCSAPLTPIGVR